MRGIIIRKKIVIGIIALLFSMLLCIGCSNSNSPISTSSTPLPQINKVVIAKAIEQSAMEDSGYRFANAEVKSQFSVYATYYIRMAKEYAGLPQVSISSETKSKIIEKFLNTSDMDLTDIFCAVSLFSRNEELAVEIKEKIVSYFDSLYNKELECYTLFYNGKSDKYIFNIYANYFVDSVANLLDIEINSIDNWLKKAVQEIFVPENISIENSSAYSMFFELAKKHNIAVPESSITAIIQMFKDTLQNEVKLESDVIYIPVFLMDYLDFANFADYDSSESYEKIIHILCDENGVKEDTFTENDAYGLYATIRALKLSNYDFESCIHFNDVFQKFDVFLVSKDLYMPPGYVESNFVDTYYVDALIHNLDIESSNTIGEYCIENKKKILEGDVLNIYYYLELLRRNDLLEIVDDEREAIIQKFSSSIHSFVTDLSVINANLPKMNGCIKGLRILDENLQVSEDDYDNIVKNFCLVSDDRQQAYDLSGLIVFICLVSPDKTNDLQQYCSQLEELLIQLSSKEVSNKIMLQNMALNAFKLSSYTATAEFKQVVIKTLLQSQNESGLFKGGDSQEDIASFRNTYDAVVLCESIV